MFLACMKMTSPFRQPSFSLLMVLAIISTSPLEWEQAPFILLGAPCQKTCSRWCSTIAQLSSLESQHFMLLCSLYQKLRNVSISLLYVYVSQQVRPYRPMSNGAGRRNSMLKSWMVSVAQRFCISLSVIVRDRYALAVLASL